MTKELVVFISCGNIKMTTPCKAEQMYQGLYFQRTLKYGKKLIKDNGGGQLFILSAKYGLLPLDKIIEPYNVALSEQSPQYKKDWAEKVISQLKQNNLIENKRAIFLASKCYREPLLSIYPDYEIPMEHCGINSRLGQMRNELYKKKKKSLI